MADVNPPSIGDISALNDAAAELEARLKLVLDEEVQLAEGFEKVTIQINEANSANLKRAEPQLQITNNTLDELEARTKITSMLDTQITSTRELLSLDTQRLAIYREMMGGGTSGAAATSPAGAAAGVRSTTAAEATGAVTAGAVGAAASRSSTVAAVESEAPQVMSVSELGASYQLANAKLTAFNDSLTQHGYLTSETIQAAQRGELTYAEWGNQIAGTAAKFGAWTAVSIPIFGAIDAFSKLYTGAVQASQGVAFVERSIKGLNTDQATAQIQALSQHFNVTIADASNAMGIMARVFPNQKQAASAAQAPLFAEKLGDLDSTTAANRFRSIAAGFQLPASSLVSIYDQLAQAQRRFGVSVDVSSTALANAGGAWKAAGGDLSGLLALTTALNYTTNISGSQIATMMTQAIIQLQQPKNQMNLRALGIDPTVGLPGVLDQAEKLAQKNPKDVLAISEALGNARTGRFFPALLDNPELLKKATAETSPAASKGIGQYELNKMLTGTEQQVVKLGVELENIGAGLARSGALTGLGLMLELVNHILEATNGLIGAWDSLPDPFKGPLATGGELFLLWKAMRAMNIGQGIPTMFGGGPLIDANGNPTMRGQMHSMFTPNPDNMTAKNVLAQARSDADASAGDFVGLQRKAATSVRAAQVQGIQIQQAEMEGVDQNTIDEMKRVYISMVQQATQVQAQAAIMEQITAQDQENLATLKGMNADQRVAWARQNMQAAAVVPYTGNRQVEMLGGEAGGAGGAGMMAVPVSLRDVNGVKMEATSGAVPIVVAEPSQAGAAVEDLGARPSIEGVATGARFIAPAATEAAEVSPTMMAMLMGGVAGGMGKVGGALGGLTEGGAGLMGAGMTYLIGSSIASMIGGAIGGGAGKETGHLGGDVAAGAAIGSIFPVIGTAGGAAIGGAASIVASIVGNNDKKQKEQIAALSKTGSYSDLVTAVAKNGLSPGAESAQKAGFGDSIGDLAMNDQGTLAAIQKLQLDQAQRNPTKPVSDQDISVLLPLGEQQLAAAKGTAAKQAVIAKFTEAINQSYQALMDGTQGQKQAAGAVATLQGQLATEDLTGGSKAISAEGFTKMYGTLSLTNQTGYDTYLKDIISERGLGASTPGGVPALTESTSAAKILEGKANALSQQASQATSITQYNELTEAADSYQKEANTLTENVLNQNTTQLTDAINEATSPEQIAEAYKRATSVAQSQMKMDPVVAKGQIASNAQAYAQYQQQMIQGQLALLNAQDPNTVNVAQRTISMNNQIASLMKKAPGQQSLLAMIQAQAQSAQAQSSILQAEQQQTQNQAQLSQAQAWNNQPLADQAVVAGYQGQISELNSAHISQASKNQQLVGLKASLVQAQLTLFNDTTQWVQNLISASTTLAGDIGNNPVNQAQQQLNAAQQVLAYGHFKTQADKLTAQSNEVTSQQNVLSQKWQEYQIQQTLSHEAISEQITGDESFLATVHKDFALRQTIQQQILQDELSAAGSYELNVGNVQLPTAYQIRRAEHALKSPHDQQSIVIHAPITVRGGEGGKKAANEISRHLHTTVKTAVKSAARSGVRR